MNQAIMKEESHVRAKYVTLIAVIAALAYWAKSANGNGEASPANASSMTEKKVELLASSEANKLKGEFGEQAASLAEEMQRDLAALPDRPQPPEKSASDDWPRGFQKTDFDLPEYCFERMGKLDHKKLVRHVELNPLDRPLDSEQVEHLRMFIDVMNRHLQKLESHYSEVRREEMRAAIKAGDVAPSPIKRMPTAILRTLAKASMKRNEHPGKSLDEVMEVINVEKIHIPSNSYVHKGRIYPHSKFKELLMTDRLFKQLQFFSFDSLGGITEWFLASGCLQPGGQAALLNRGSAFTRLDLAERGPLYRGMKK